MTNESQDNTPSPELLELRSKIDQVDEKIIALLEERAGYVNNVGSLKRRTHPGQCPIRPGREADMVRAIMKKTSGTGFSPAAAAAIWRIMIGTYTSLEGNLQLSIYTPDKNDTLYWLAREYFGPAVPTMRQPHVKRVIGDVLDGKATVGIVPLLTTNDPDPWWTSLLQKGGDMPKIFAHIPFVHADTNGRDMPSALALARIDPEPTGDDITLLVLETEHNVSQHRLQSLFTQVKLEASWVNIATPHPTMRHHLVSIKGFLTAEHAQIKELSASLGAALLNLTILGSYATPVMFAGANQPERPHATATSA